MHVDCYQTRGIRPFTCWPLCAGNTFRWFGSSSLYNAFSDDCIIPEKWGRGVGQPSVNTNSRPITCSVCCSSRQYPRHMCLLLSREEERWINSAKWANVSITTIAHYYYNGEGYKKKKRYPFISVYFIKNSFPNVDRIVNVHHPVLLWRIFENPDSFIVTCIIIMRGWIFKRVQWKLMSDVIIILNPLVPVRSPMHSISRK